MKVIALSRTIAYNQRRPLSYRTFSWAAVTGNLSVKMIAFEVLCAVWGPTGEPAAPDIAATKRRRRQGWWQ